jgi:hypothetical protein
MLSKVKALIGYKLYALDGEIGRIKAFHFDDRYWTIRYLGVETGDWLLDRQVLISPCALVAVNRQKHHITVDLTKKQIADSPHLSTDRPVSRQFEEAYHGYFGWPTYWSDSYILDRHSHLVRDKRKWRESVRNGRSFEPHLRSTRDVNGRRVQASDGEIGHVDDFIIDDNTWTIRYLIVDTRNLLPGKRVLIAPQWIECVNWSESKVQINLLRETIRQSPEFKDESLPAGDYESSLHRYYNRREYWMKEPYSKSEYH